MVKIKPIGPPKPPPIKRRGKTRIPNEVLERVLKATLSGIPENARLSGMWTRGGIGGYTEAIFQDESFPAKSVDERPVHTFATEPRE
jgi:hypothetical protein